MGTLFAAFDPHAFRWGSSHAPLAETLVILVALATAAVASALVFRYLRVRDRRHTRVSDEWSALSVMGELCPTGWQARITVYGGGAPVPADAPPSRVPPVALEWKQFGGSSGAAVVARRLWAPSIGSALQAMADDRLTDLVLEEAEQAAERAPRRT